MRTLVYLTHRSGLMLHFVDRSGLERLIWLDDWTTSSPDQVTRFFVANSHLTDQLESGLTRFFYIVLQAVHWLNKNTVRGSKRNIEAHYDLGNQLFETFLDPTLMYSSALFSDDNKDLHEASLEKLDHICRKLHLKPTDHVLEIGTGWGLQFTLQRIMDANDDDNHI